MHEMSLTQSVVEICQRHAGGRRVTGVVLEIGELAGVVPESIEFCFEICVERTVLEGAQLKLELIPGTGHCPRCSCRVALRTLFDHCPHCGSLGMELVSGQELRVKELEVE